MLSFFKSKKIKVFWEDAVIYGPSHGNKFYLSEKITVGEVVMEDSDFIVLKDPETKAYRRDKKDWAMVYTDKKTTFFCIPKGMIKKIDK